RHILSELDSLGDEGVLIQRRIVTELCKLRGLPDLTVPSRDAALDALRKLKQLAIDQKLYQEQQTDQASQRAAEAARKQAAIVARSETLRRLHSELVAMIKANDPQPRGYSLEKLLADLFAIHDITYRPPYRTATEQIDGYFPFKGFEYLVEARWRKDPPTEGDLSEFKGKVDRKITS